MKQLLLIVTLSLVSVAGFAQPMSSCSSELSQCYQDNRNLQNQLMYTQNQLYQCQNSNSRWNCSYTCGGNVGMGSDSDKATACQQARRDAHATCGGVQCECTRE